MKIDTFDKSNLTSLRHSLNLALEDVAKMYGIVLSLGNMRYSNNEVKMKLTANIGTANDLALENSDKVKDDLNYLSMLYDLPKDLFGKEIKIGGEDFIILDSKSSRPKYPFIVTGTNGRKYKMSVEQIRSGIHRSSIQKTIDI